jgi:hypothetical protein
MQQSKFSDFAKYSMPDDHLPRRMDKAALTFLRSVRREISEAERTTISDLYACHPSQWQRTPTRLEFITFGTFRKFYPVVEALSEMLAQLYLEYGILPDIWPIVSPPERLLQKDVVPLLRKSGILVYTRETT